MALTAERAHWGSRLGFVLAAAGSAVGLGNIWRFPYVVGENGGGLFVLAYVLCIALIGLPVLMAEVFIGRTAQNSPVGAFRTLSRRGSPWIAVGWLGVIAGFVILSFYSVVAGWCMHYAWISVTTTFNDMSPEQISETWNGLYTSPTLSTMWHLIFMAVTISIVVAGIKEGIELWVKILMPVLLVLMLILLGYSIQSGHFGQGLSYLLAPDFEQWSWRRSTLAALGQGLFTLSVGMGALITYGSYLRKDDDLTGTSLTVGGLDTIIALLAVLVIFPILFAAILDPAAGPGLVFVTLPNAFATMTGGMILAPVFFILLTFAALTSAISLLEVTTAYFIDERGWSRTKAALGTGGLIAILGIPSAVASTSVLFGDGVKDLTSRVPVLFGEEGQNWFGVMDYFAESWLLPLGALGISLFVGWRVPNDSREAGFKAGSKLAWMYDGWVILLRFVVPLIIAVLFLQGVGFLDWLISLLPFGPTENG
jgi:neurotransmitter:Na+ symporter, NSS family